MVKPGDGMLRQLKQQSQWRRQTTHDSQGLGADREEPKETPEEEKPQHKQQVAEGDAEDRKKLSDSEWGPIPAIQKQFQKGPDFWRDKSARVEIFDLSDKDQRAEYSRLVHSSELLTGNEFITVEDRQFVPEKSNWVVFVKIREIEYRQLIRNEKK